MVLQVHGCILIELIDQKSLTMGIFIIVFFILTKNCSNNDVEETHLHS